MTLEQLQNLVRLDLVEGMNFANRVRRRDQEFHGVDREAILIAYVVSMALNRISSALDSRF